MENVFLSYHFDPETESMATQIKRLVQSHDLEVIDGQRLAGQQLTDAVADRIKASDAMIVLLSKRDEGKTNDWVKHERSTAYNNGIPFIALIEEGLPNNGPFETFEYIRYDRHNLVEALLRISETIFRWRLSLGERIEAHLEPEDIVEAVRSNLGHHDMVKYRFFDHRDGWSEWKDAVVKPQAGGVCLLIEGVRKNTEIQIKVATRNGIKVSDAINRNLRISVNNDLL